jgi:chorismate mutase
MPVRGVRGATTAAADTRDAILTATRELLEAMVAANRLSPEDIAAIFFTTTPDLTAEFPAAATRTLDWPDLPMLCGHEMGVPASNDRAVARCIRVLLLWNTDVKIAQVRSVYLHGARALERVRERP